MILQPKKVILADEISTGLDSSTTYEIVKWMADTTHAMNNTTLIALLQPAPETFELFDDVLLLRCGSCFNCTPVAVRVTTASATAVLRLIAIPCNTFVRPPPPPITVPSAVKWSRSSTRF